MISLNPLEGFYMVAVHRSYARAARNFRYPISQPGVHQQVKKLERELEVKLFERVGRGEMALTAAGRYLFDFVRPFFEQLPAVSRAIAAQQFGGELRIEAGNMAIRQVLPGWVRRMRAARDDVSISLAECPFPDLERLRSGACDLLVDYLPELPPWCTGREVARATAWLVVPADRFAEGPLPAIDGLGAMPLVAYPAETLHRRLQLDALPRAPDQVLSASSADAILAFVAAGLGFSLIPWVEADGPRLAGVRAQSFPDVTFPISAVWRADLDSPLIEMALDALPRPAG